jgi:hypothetical protein
MNLINLYFYHSFCSDLMFTKKEIEDINDDDLMFENVEKLHLPMMVISGCHIPNISSRSILKIVRDFNLEIFLKNSHLQIYDDFNDQDTILVYDSYNDLVLLNCHDHDCCSQVHDLIAFKLNETCENKTLVNQSHLSCTISVNSKLGDFLNTNNSL